MSGLEDVERYLRVHAGELARRSSTADTTTIHPFITISRQAGTGGHDLAERIVEHFSHDEDPELGGHWQVFDQRLCEIAAADPRFARSIEPLLAEEYHTKTENLFRQILHATLDQDVVMERVFRVVRAVATIGRAIIVGRAGNEVTRGMGPAVSLRLVAPFDDRIARVASRDGIDPRAARDRTQRTDLHRARLLKSQFGVDIDDPTRYDLTINSAALAHDDITATVAELLRRRAKAARAER